MLNKESKLTKMGTLIRKVNLGLSLALILALGIFSSCDEDYISYDGPSFIMFADSTTVLPVQVTEEYTDIPVVATKIYSYDRTIGVEVDQKSSNAIEGKHYEIESSTITIKAGENVANVRVRGIYDEVGISDNLSFVLKLVEDKSQVWDVYGDGMTVSLYKVCPFNLEDFTGYATVRSSWMNYYMTVTQRLITTEIDPNNENTIILHSPFYDGYDMSIRFTTDDILNPLIETDDQVFCSTADAFGTIYGDDGIVRIMDPASSGYLSYYSCCENFVNQYATLYVPNYPTGYNVAVGIFLNLYTWITDDEAERLKLQGY